LTILAKNSGQVMMDFSKKIYTFAAETTKQ